MNDGSNEPQEAPEDAYTEQTEQPEAPPAVDEATKSAVRGMTQPEPEPEPAEEIELQPGVVYLASNIRFAGGENADFLKIDALPAPPMLGWKVQLPEFDDQKAQIGEVLISAENAIIANVAGGISCEKTMAESLDSLKQSGWIRVQ